MSEYSKIKENQPNNDRRELEVSFFVAGSPVSKGSWSAFSSHTTGRMIFPKSAALRSWESSVANSVRIAASRSRIVADLLRRSSIHVELEFRISRSKSHYGTGKNSSLLKPSSPNAHTQKPDIDKLVRAVLDGIVKGDLIGDDSQVVSLIAKKRWCKDSRENAGCLIIVAVAE